MALGHGLSRASAAAGSDSEPSALRRRLAGRGLERHKRLFLQLSRAQLTQLQERYDDLENWVYARNGRSIRCLRWLGFTLEPAAPYGRFGRPFHRFWMRTDRMQNHA